MSLNTAPKKKSIKGLLSVLILMCFLIGFMSGFYVTLNIPIQKMQSIIQNIDVEIMTMINSVFNLV